MGPYKGQYFGPVRSSKASPRLSVSALRGASILLFCGLLVLSLESLTSRHVTSTNTPDAVIGRRDSRRSFVTSRDPDVKQAASDHNALKLLLATHNRLLWYYPDSNEYKAIHEGEGVHYGVFPGHSDSTGRLVTLWNVIRPHNWHPQNTAEYLVQLDADSGVEVARVKIPSRFSHDAVRVGSKVYVCSTEQGTILELTYPSMALSRQFQLFTKRDHINSLAPAAASEMWVLLHNLGKSDIVKLDLDYEPPVVVERIQGVGAKAHGLVAWKGGLLLLDSEAGALVCLELPSKKITVLWQAPDSGKFLKGLAVVDDVAYFGVSVWSTRAGRGDPSSNSELAAFHLTSGKLLWRREVPTQGLLNIVAAPQLGEASTYRAMYTAAGVSAAMEDDKQATARSPHTVQASQADQGAGRSDDAGSDDRSSSNNSYSSSSSSSSSKLDRRSGDKQHSVVRLDAITSIDDRGVQQVSKLLDRLGYKPVVGGFWPSGLPYLHQGMKQSNRSWSAGIQLPLMVVDISKLKAVLQGTPPLMWDEGEQRRSNAVVDGRDGNMNKFKPGVGTIYLVFSDRSTQHVYYYPYYEYFRAAVDPILKQILGEGALSHIIRLQFALMPPGSTIKMHRDMGGYAQKAHRIHVPVITHPNVSFQVCPQLEQRNLNRKGAITDKDVSNADDCVEIPMAEGMVFEVNNRVLHRVLNNSPITRIQLVIDVAENARQPIRLKPGAICDYVHAEVVCPPEFIVS